MPSRNFKNVEIWILIIYMITAIITYPEQIGCPEKKLFPEKQVII